MIGELAALGAAICWTASAVLYKKALQKTKPVSANIVRLTCTGGILLLVLIVAGKFGVLTSLPMNAAILAAVSGIVGLGLGDTLYMASLKLLGVARAVPITCTYPLFNILWAIFIVQEQVSQWTLIGAAVILSGIWLIAHEEEANQTEMQTKTLAKGVILALGTAVMWSISITMIDVAVTLPEGNSFDYALAVNAIRVVAIAVVLLASAPIIDRHRGFLKMQRKTLILLIVGGMVALALGWFLLTVGLQNAPESRAVPISSTTPLFSTLSAMVLLRERVTLRNALGSAIIVGGIFLIFLV